MITATTTTLLSRSQPHHQHQIPPLPPLDHNLQNSDTEHLLHLIKFTHKYLHLTLTHHLVWSTAIAQCLPDYLPSAILRLLLVFIICLLPTSWPSLIPFLPKETKTVIELSTARLAASFMLHSEFLLINSGLNWICESLLLCVCNRRPDQYSDEY